MSLDIRRDHFGYWSGDLLVTPLVNEETVAAAYLQFKKDGLLDVVFHEYQVSLRWFLDFLLNDKTDILACGRLKSDGSFELCGLGWINNWIRNPGHSRCDVGHGFFKGFWGHGVPLTLTRLMLEYIFQGLNSDVCYGVVPESNRLSLAFAKRLGFTLHGPVPGFTKYRGVVCGAYFCTVTKEQWADMSVFQEVVEHQEVA